ncbi:MAG: hypothetical protein WBE76_12395 [Terracidiphilus sp.]
MHSFDVCRIIDLLAAIMLPDFPKLKGRLMDLHLRDIRAKVDAQMPVVSRIRSVRFHEGNCFGLERDDGVVESKGFVDVRAPIQVAANLEFRDTVQSLKERTEQLTLDFAAQLEKFFFERFEEITSSVGNSVDMKGAPFTAESHLDTLERVDLEFDIFGFPIYPMHVCHPVMAETIRSEMARFGKEPHLRDRGAALIERKRKEWRDREGRRRLVT